MDPYAALRDLDDGIDSRSMVKVYDAADALIGWLKTGGFGPFDDENDWRSGLTTGQFINYLRDLRSLSKEE